MASFPYLVAGADAPTAFKDAADYVCDGTADEVQLNAALAALPADMGVVTAVGTFHIADSIRVLGHSHILQGWGTGHRDNATHDSEGTKFVVQAGFSGAEAILVQHVSESSPLHGVTLRDFTLDGVDVGADLHGITHRSHTSVVDHVHVHRMTGDGVRLRGYTAAETGGAAWATYDTIASRLIVSKCGGSGLHFDELAQDAHAMMCVIYDNGVNVEINAGSQQLTGCHTYSSTAGPNVWLNGSGSRTKIVNLKCEQSWTHGIFLDGTDEGTSDVMIIGSNFKNNGQGADNTYDHILIDGPSTHSRPNISGNNFSWTSGNKARYGVNFNSSDSQLPTLVGNSFGSASHFGTAPLRAASSVTLNGYGNQMPSAKTNNGGVASIANGGTITHLLAQTPKRYSVTPTVAGHIAVVTAVNSTTLTVALHNHDGTAVAVAENVAWTADV